VVGEGAKTVPYLLIDITSSKFPSSISINYVTSV
jgi:hypothetical protein